MINLLQQKFDNLEKKIYSYGSAAIAFSGGVDSAFLAAVLHRVLPGKSLAVTIDSEAYPPENLAECISLASMIGIELIVIKKNVCELEEFAENLPERCYYCKKALFSSIYDELKTRGISILLDGSNADDLGDYRPGMRAIKELDVKSPLLELGFTKKDIRALSKEIGLPTWNRQSFACLASRFPYGTRITPDLLEKVWRAEAVLKEIGFKNYRVRNHGDIARIELDLEGIKTLMEETTRKKVAESLKQLGFKYITLDIEGYRTGSMNETI
jgi:uncharacterized protein